MNTVWILVGLALAGVVLAIVTAWRRSDRLADLGAVSHQWIAEHRAASGPDSRR
jgi:hypothetical protein